MAEKCVLCNAKIEMTFLGKIKGAYVRKKAVCSVCQRKFGKDLIPHVPL